MTELAQSMFNRIGDGHRHAVKRPVDTRIDRSLRRLIEHANRNGDCIISGRTGYYRPIPTDTIDAYEYSLYMKLEHSRIQSLLIRETCMKVSYESRLRGCMHE